MPRRPRTHLPGQPLRIVLRGHNREPCFFAEEDCHSFLHWLGESMKAPKVALHGYVLMTNHVHLLIAPRRPEDVAGLMISLGRRYVQYINKTYRRTGTLWDGRYKSSLIQSDLYLLTCLRYIELNPVRAAMVEDPSHHRWSSYRANALGVVDPRITPHPLYLALGITDNLRQTAYRALFSAELDAEAIADIRLAINQNQVLGNGRFHRKIEQVSGERREARPRGRPKKSVGSDGGLAGVQGDFGI